MEKWIDRFQGKIPHCGYEYLVDIKSGDTDGLKIMLEHIKENEFIDINFSSTRSVRITDEGLYLTDMFDSKEIDKFKKDGFESVIYEIKDGEYGNFINKTSAGLAGMTDLKHYIIITLNYVIEVINGTDPKIKILKP